MANTAIPHFHNSAGLTKIEIHAKEFQCIGANPPFNHPHVYLDMGSEVEIICPYCSTLYTFNPTLEHGKSLPLSAVYLPV